WAPRSVALDLLLVGPLPVVLTHDLSPDFVRRHRRISGMELTHPAGDPLSKAAQSVLAWERWGVVAPPIDPSAVNLQVSSGFGEDTIRGVVPKQVVEPPEHRPPTKVLGEAPRPHRLRPERSTCRTDRMSVVETRIVWGYRMNPADRASDPG